jgi:glucose/arabinose dehydrogenase
MPRLVVMLLFALTLPAAAAQAAVGYGIPADNPFVSIPKARGEVYVYGMRNPYRWSFDRLTGDMYIADVGGNQREEITFLPRRYAAGANLGWHCFEGTAVQKVCDPPNYFPPTHQYKSSANVVIGGVVVRAPSLPSFTGRYLYGRYFSGIYALGRRASGRAVNTGVDIEGITSVGEDGAGHLYATSFNGPVYRLRERGGSLALRRIGTFSRPVMVTAPPGDAGRLFIVEKEGRVILRAGGRSTVFLDLTALVRARGYEEGLLGFALAPDYATSGRLFAYYTNNAGDLQLDEYTRTAAAPDRSDVSTRKALLTIQHDRSIVHHGGQLLFGPDRHLYLSTGDGDREADPDGDAQSLRSLLGKILRLDVGYREPAAPDTTAPALRARVNARQRVLRQRGAMAYVRCSESCSVVARGRLLVAGREYAMRRVAARAGPGRPCRLEVRLTAAGRQALSAAGRALVRLRLQARDAAGNRSAATVRKVQMRR